MSRCKFAEGNRLVLADYPKVGVERSLEARVRLAWMDCDGGCSNVTHTCRHFGISRQTFYRRQRRYDRCDLTTLEERTIVLDDDASRLRLRTGLSATRTASVRAAAPFFQTQRRRTRQPHPHRGVRSGHPLLPGNAKTQSRTPPLGKNLQHRPPSSGPRLLSAAPVPTPVLIPTKAMKVSSIYWTSTTAFALKEKLLRCSCEVSLLFSSWPSARIILANTVVCAEIWGRFRR